MGEGRGVILIIWKIFYWSTYIFGYFIFVILGELDRKGKKHSIVVILMDYYFAKFVYFILIFLVCVVVVSYLLVRGMMKMFFN